MACPDGYDDIGSGICYNPLTDHSVPNDTSAPSTTAPTTGSTTPALNPVIRTIELGGGRVVEYYKNGTSQVKDYGQTGSGQEDPAISAAKAGYWTTDATGRVVPDVAKFVAALDAQHARTAAGPAGRSIPTLTETAAAGGYFNPDGSIDTAGYLASKSAIPPSLAPGRPAIVAYLQALLGQNALPYNGISTDKSRNPAPAPTTGAVPSLVDPMNGQVPTFTPPAAGTPIVPYGPGTQSPDAQSRNLLAQGTPSLNGYPNENTWAAAAGRQGSFASPYDQYAPRVPNLGY